MPAPVYDDLISAVAFGWLMTAMVVGISASWIVVDIVRLRRALRDDTAHPTVRDRVFGSIMGIIIGSIGVGGGLLHHLG
jgi:hypothetical protein